MRASTRGKLVAAALIVALVAWSGPTTAGAATVLFDDFSGAFPGTAWVDVERASVDGAVGNPAPGLRFGQVGVGAGYMRTVQTYNTGAGFSLSFDVLTTGGQVSVSVKDPSSTAYSNDRTALSVSPSSVSGAFWIHGGGQNFGGSATYDQLWHHYEFRVADGTATWSRDGAVRYTHAYDPHDVYVYFADGNGTVWYDNITITTGGTSGTPTSISIRTSTTSVYRPKPFVLSGVLTGGSVGELVVVWVKKPGKSYYSYSSNRLCYSAAPGGANWWYRYTPYTRTCPAGTYYFKASYPGSAAKAPCVSGVITVRAR